MLRRLACAAGLAFAAAASAHAAADTPPTPKPDAPLTAAVMFADPVIAGAQISPDGHHVAVIKRDGDTSVVIVEDLSTSVAKVIFGVKDKSESFDWLRWKSNRQLIIGATYLRIFRVNQAKADSPITGWKYGKFMVSVGVDGTGAVMLFKSDKGTARKTGGIMEFLDPLRGDPDHILAVAPTTEGPLAVWKTDLHTGAAEMIEKGDDDTLSWVTDRSGALIARYRLKGRTLLIEGRAPGESAWSLITQIKKKEWQKEAADFEILGDGPTPATIYVSVRPRSPTDGEVRSIHVYDLHTRSLGPNLWPDLTYDISTIVQTDSTSALKGVCYWVDTLQCDFKDAVMQANFRGIAKFFDNQVNVAPVSWSDDGAWSVLQVSGPGEPGAFYLYDWSRHQLSNLGTEHSDLPADRLGVMQRYPYKARDGTLIPAYLTRPPSSPKGPLPLIVMPHGGPMARDNFDFDSWSQFLATRGFLVLQPNYRGSGGYGEHWLEAGFKQWGGLMQDDITDGVKALIAAGLADPHRICVFGASYGGYSALMQGALHPELYRCVVSWAGISDLGKLLKDDRSDGKDNPVYQYELKEVGDPDADKAALAKASPISYAADFAPPVLLVHGDADTIVAPDQSRDMERALKRAHHDVRLIVVKDENHRDWDTDHLTATMESVATFLEAHTAPAAH